MRLNITYEVCLDPRKACDPCVHQTLLMCYDGLVRYQEGGGYTLSTSSNHKVSADGKIHTFTLKPHSWSDGTAVLAQDYVYAIQTALAPDFAAPWAQDLFCIRNARSVKAGLCSPDQVGVRAVSAEILVFELAEPVPHFLELCSLPAYFPYKPSPQEDRPLVNGPFRVKEWVHTHQLTLEKNPHYWNASATRLDAVELMMIDHIPTELSLYLSGELDLAGYPLSELPAQFIPEVANRSDFKQQPRLSLLYLLINGEEPILADPRFRRALSLAIRRDEICSHILRSAQKPARSLIPDGPDLFDDDIQLAKQLLEACLADHPDFDASTLSVQYYREDPDDAVLQAIQQMWKTHLGLEIPLRKTGAKQHFSRLKQGDYTLARSGYRARLSGPGALLAAFEDTSDVYHRWRPATPAAQAALDKARTCLNPTLRLAYLNEANAALIAAMPIIPLYFPSGDSLVHPHLQGLILSPTGILDIRLAHFN